MRMRWYNVECSVKDTEKSRGNVCHVLIDVLLICKDKDWVGIF